MPDSFNVPNLQLGRSHKGPDYYKSHGSGHAPVIHRSREGHRSYIVCHEGDLQEAITRNKEKRLVLAMSTNGRRMHFYTQKEAADSRFRALCKAQIEANRQVHLTHTTQEPKARKVASA
jgi:hypothetical protein